MPPPSRTLPIVRPATTPCLVRPVRVRRRVKFRVFSMPLWRRAGAARFRRAGHDHAAARPRL